MPRYTIRLSSSRGDAEPIYIPTVAANPDAAARIAGRQLDFRRRFAWHGNRWDTWTVLYSHLHGSEPQVKRNGKVDR